MKAEFLSTAAAVAEACDRDLVAEGLRPEDFAIVEMSMIDAVSDVWQVRLRRRAYLPTSDEERCTAGGDVLVRVDVTACTSTLCFDD
jgi:hypothetical protein